MTLIREFDQAAALTRGGAISIGNFDGVHRGHAILLTQLRRMADAVGGPAVVVTFDPHPAAVLRPDQAPVPLTWMERRAELLKQQGVDVVIACRPDLELLELSAEAFFDDIVRQRLGAGAMVEGPNFFFGKNRVGNVALLRNLCDANRMPLQIVEALSEAGDMISSTLIRAKLASGDLRSANRMLTSPYRIRGEVRAGAGRGKDLGFPTANLHQIPVLIPGPGVYSGETSVDGQAFKAAIHVGPNVTFGEGHCKVEVHLLNFNGNLYGRTVDVQLNAKIRESIKFSSVDALREQMHHDIQAIRNQSLL
ncbi:MAG: riboflavin biosynthesis protein RibF [Pirellulaceae bacterium]